MLSMTRTLRRTLTTIPAAAAVALLAAAPAQASRVSESAGTLEYDAGGGEANRVLVTFAAAGSGRVTTTIADSEGIAASGNCSYPNNGNRLVVTCVSRQNETVRADLDVGDGDDSLRVTQRSPGRAIAVRISDGAGNDVVTVNEGETSWVNGPGNDIYQGGSGRDTALPGDGDDFIRGGYGDDGLDGGVGNDQLSGDVGNDRLDGGDGFDLVEGNAGNDDARGGADGDFVFGGGGNDRLSGDSGFDQLFGGPGSDTVDGSTTQDNRTG